MDGMYKDFGIVDEDALRDAKRVPTCDVVEKLFPGHRVRRRGVFCSPFRDDRKPSFSPYPGHGGDWLWKDHATGEGGDNLALYRKVFPELSYTEAVDGLCRLVLGRPGLKDGVVAAATRRPADILRRSAGTSSRAEVQQQLAQSVKRVCSLDDASVPAAFREYWRGRGISDEVILRYCEYVCFENANQKGRPLMDPVSMLPLLDDAGNVAKDDGLRHGIGLKNDIGGYAIRVPDTPSAAGFKTNTTNFIATFLHDGSRPRRIVSLHGDGDGMVQFLRYDSCGARIWINPGQCFVNVRADAQRFAAPFLERFVGERLYSREAGGVSSVLDALCSPFVSRGIVVEGMFDALSARELSRIRQDVGAGDMVVLNSVGNTRWAAPFLALHGEVLVMLDNDVRSGAGQNAYRQLCEDISRYNGVYGNRSVIFNGASLYSGYKDLNDALKAYKGISAKCIAPGPKPRKDMKSLSSI